MRNISRTSVDLTGKIVEVTTDAQVNRKSAPSTISIFKKQTEKSRKRVLLFTNSVAQGGMEEHVVLIARHLNRKSFEIYGICPEWPETTEFSRKVRMYSDHFELITPDRRYGILREIKEFVRFYKQLKHWDIDVMHIHGTTFRSQNLALLAGKLARVPKIYLTEHLAPEKPLSIYERVTRSIFSSLLDGVVCVSQKNYQARSNQIYTPQSRTLVINNGVDIADFNPVTPEILENLRMKYDIPAEAPIVGTVVRFEPEKGLEYLIEAMVSIKAACPDSYLLLVGDGSIRKQLEAQVDALGLRPFTRFAGFQRDPKPYLGLMDAFVLPVPVGSMSIGLLEAMAMRKAVVITFGGNGEAVTDGETGFCAEPRNPSSIAEAVTQILLKPELKHRLGEAARERVEEHFSASRVARMLEELYSRQ